MKEGWEHKPLGSICSIARGGSPRPIQEFLTDAADGVNWIKISDATASGRYIHRTAEKIKPAGVAKSRLVKEGDFLLSNSMSFGRPYIMRTSGCIHDGWLVLSGYQETFDQTFLYHVLGSPQVFAQFDRLAAGSTVRNLNIDLASRVVVPVPPLPEQRRIVAMLDEAFEAIAKVKANTEKNLQSAREVFEANLEAAFCHQGPDWKQAKLQDICTLYNGRAYNKDELLSAGKYPVLRVGNFFTNKHWYYSDLELDEHKYCDFGDLLYAWSASFGPRMWDGGKVIFHYHIWKVVPRADRVEREYLKYLLEWDTEKIKAAQGTGTTMMHVGKGAMEARVVPVPPLTVQRLIVTQLDALNQEVELLSDLLSRKLTALDELKRSLLHQAFSGRLTAKTTEKQLAEVA